MVLECARTRSQASEELQRQDYCPGKIPSFARCDFGRCSLIKPLSKLRDNFCPIRIMMFVELFGFVIDTDLVAQGVAARKVESFGAQKTVSRSLRYLLSIK